MNKKIQARLSRFVSFAVMSSKKKKNLVRIRSIWKNLKISISWFPTGSNRAGRGTRAVSLPLGKRNRKYAAEKTSSCRMSYEYNKVMKSLITALLPSPGRGVTIDVTPRKESLPTRVAIGNSQSFEFDRRIVFASIVRPDTIRLSCRV